ncbi:unnamed protein product [Trichobilharzia regenti]|uniref:Homeobox protein 2-like n=1 Tax=Trichobilharzia regenti TaxID=157069 RepID=A0A183WI68_TRIRE|nr:unnamed protein product [Trichobilharzia regenti]VDQ07701.1 unnamed protein product [Trichobilharzia regenti]
MTIKLPAIEHNEFKMNIDERKCNNIIYKNNNNNNNNNTNGNNIQMKSLNEACLKLPKIFRKRWSPTSPMSTIIKILNQSNQNQGNYQLDKQLPVHLTLKHQTNLTKFKQDTFHNPILLPINYNKKIHKKRNNEKRNYRKD